MVKTKFFKTLVLVFSAVLLLSSFATTASAHTFSTSNIYEETKEPVMKNYEWANLEAATATHQTPNYFIIDTTAGGRTESLYISLPAEGGFRLQSKHQYQEDVEVSNVGLFEPSSIAVIDYKTDSKGAVLMTGSDGTTVRYSVIEDGFALEVLSADGTRIIYITNWQISFGYQKDGTIVRTVVEMPMDVDKEVIYNGCNRYTTTITTPNTPTRRGPSVSATISCCSSVLSPPVRSITPPTSRATRYTTGKAITTPFTI